jgi:hypothetical protein
MRRGTGRLYAGAALAPDSEDRQGLQIFRLPVKHRQIQLFVGSLGFCPPNARRRPASLSRPGGKEKARRGAGPQVWGRKRHSGCYAPAVVVNGLGNYLSGCIPGSPIALRWPPAHDHARRLQRGALRQAREPAAQLGGGGGFAVQVKAARIAVTSASSMAIMAGRWAPGRRRAKRERSRVRPALTSSRIDCGTIGGHPHCRARGKRCLQRPSLPCTAERPIRRW